MNTIEEYSVKFEIGSILGYRIEHKTVQDYKSIVQSNTTVF